ncbi:MAG: HD domain-containing protein [Chloroflexota bacterium]
MLITLESIFPEAGIYQIIRRHAHQNQRIYLVGGCIRDLLLGQRSRDIDFIVNGDAIHLARQVAAELNAGFFVLDDERKTARVILHDPQGGRYYLDFARMRGFHLEQDLKARDFTVNALAIDLLEENHLIDPLNGAVDLRNKILRACGEDSFQQDPVRVLRAVRFARQLGFQIEKQTLQWLRVAVDQLPRTSMERQRDEFFRMLEGNNIFSVISLLDRLGILGVLIPELERTKGIQQSAPHGLAVWEHTLETLRWLEELYNLLVLGTDYIKGENLLVGMASLSLGRFRPHLQQHFSAAIHSERNLRELIFFAALLHDIGKPQTQEVQPDGRIRFFHHERDGAAQAEQIGRRFALSNLEVERLTLLVKEHMRIHHLASVSSEISRRSIYRYFRKVEEKGVDICLLSLADTLATYGMGIPPAHWERELTICRQLLEAWFEKREEVVVPPRLLSGDDLIKRFNLSPGPRLGKLLENVREAQAAGQIHSIDEALNLVELLLKDYSEEGTENHGTEKH